VAFSQKNYTRTRNRLVYTSESCSHVPVTLCAYITVKCGTQYSAETVLIIFPLIFGHSVQGKGMSYRGPCASCWKTTLVPRKSWSSINVGN